MRIFTLDASEWQTPLAFYESLLALLEAPHWHGTSIGALTDSMIYGGINGVDPPYKIWIKGTENVPPDIKTELRRFVEDITEHRGPEKGIIIQIDP